MAGVEGEGSRARTLRRVVTLAVGSDTSPLSVSLVGPLGEVLCLSLRGRGLRWLRMESP